MSVNVTISTPETLPTGVDPDADVKQSPLWPLQQELRGIVRDAFNNNAFSTVQVARMTATYTQVKEKFSLWRAYTSLTKLRGVIRELLDPKFLDVKTDPALAALQAQLIAATHWNDTLST